MEQKLSPEDALRVAREWETGERISVLLERVKKDYYTPGTEIAIDMHWLVGRLQAAERQASSNHAQWFDCHLAQTMLLWKLHSLDWKGTLESVKKEYVQWLMKNKEAGILRRD